jgi:hypothetical protein
MIGCKIEVSAHEIVDLVAFFLDVDVSGVVFNSAFSFLKKE